MNEKPTKIEVRDDPNIGDTPEQPPRIVPVKSPRITVVENVYHQIPGENVNGPPPSRFYRWLESDEQAYTRSIKIGMEWQELDLGWLKGKQGALLIITNNLKRLPSRKPSAEEENEFYSKVLEIGILERDGKVTPIAYIPIGEDIRLPPLSLDRYRIRCQTENGKYLIFLVGM